jgi:heptosyltransferase-2
MSATMARHDAPTAAPNISLSPARSSTATESRRTLIIASQWVGDAILSLPLLADLQRAGRTLDVLALPSVAAVYRCSPSVQTVHEVAFARGQLQWRLRRRIAKDLCGQYEMAVVLPNSLKSALIPWLAGIPLRRGMVGEARYGLINDRRRQPAPAIQSSAHSGHAQRAPMIAHYLQLADHPRPPTDIDPLGKDQPRLQLPANVARPKASGPLLALCPGAEYGPAKQWPAEYFAQTAAYWLSQSPQHQVVVLGSPKEQALCDAIRQQTLITMQSAATAGSGPIASGAAPEKRISSLAGQTTLLDAFGWIAIADRVISNDSGLMHAAAAFDTPVIALFGSTDPMHTPPHSHRAEILHLGLSCSPCFERDCPLGTTACLRELMPEQVITRI